MNIKEIIIRAVKTFIEAALGYAMVNMGAVVLDLDDPDVTFHALACLLVSAIAAGASAMWNGVIEPIIRGSALNER